MSATWSRHVALLRGVNNIGMAKRVSMADLRTLFEGLGLRDVRTLLGSGTVVFSEREGRVPSVRGRIEKAIASRLEISCGVTLLSAKEVVAMVKQNPLRDLADDPSRMLVVVLREVSDRAKLRPLLARRWAPEALATGRRAAYLWCANSVAESALWPEVDRALGRTGTARNLRTMTKLAALVKEAT